MKKPDTILDAIHETRRKIEENTRNMMPAEQTAYFNQRGGDRREKVWFQNCCECTRSKSSAKSLIPTLFAMSV